MSKDIYKPADFRVPRRWFLSAGSATLALLLAGCISSPDGSVSLPPLALAPREGEYALAEKPIYFWEGGPYFALSDEQKKALVALFQEANSMREALRDLEDEGTQDAFKKSVDFHALGIAVTPFDKPIFRTDIAYPYDRLPYMYTVNPSQVFLQMTGGVRVCTVVINGNCLWSGFQDGTALTPPEGDYLKALIGMIMHELWHCSGLNHFDAWRFTDEPDWQKYLEYPDMDTVEKPLYYPDTESVVAPEMPNDVLFRQYARDFSNQSRDIDTNPDQN